MLVIIFSSEVLAQGEECSSPHVISLESSYQTTSINLDGLESYYVEFSPNDSIAYFEILSDGDYPESMELYETDCDEAPLEIVYLDIDSNNVEHLSFFYLEFNPSMDYILKINQNSTESVEMFNLGTLDPNDPIGEPLCDKIWNGSFEMLEPGAPLNDGNRGIWQAKGWLNPNSQNNGADFFHSNMSTSTYEIPNNLFGTADGVIGSDSDDAYAGLFTLNTPLNGHYSAGEFREWGISILLSQTAPMNAGEKYRITYSVNLASDNSFNSACVPPGIAFTDHSTVNYDQQQIVALDADIQPEEIVTQSGEWITIRQIYTAQGDEKYLTFANFLTDNESVPSSQQNSFNRSYFFIDGISIKSIDECCSSPPLEIPDGWDVSDLKNSPVFSPFINGNTFELAEEVYFNGTFTVNDAFTFENSNLVMNEGAEIEIVGSNTLTVDHSIVEACGDMWDGIKVYNTNAELVVDQSEIWSAISGIHSINGGDYTISNTIFDGNFNGIYVDEYDGVHDGTVISSTFQSTYLLRAPHQGARSNSGIYLDEVINSGSGSELLIGTDMSDDLNLFFGPEPMGSSGEITPGLRYGIYADKSSATIYNNEFNSFIRLTSTDPQTKSGIKVEGIPIHTYYFGYFPEVTVGGSTFYRKNSFIESTSAVDIELIADAYIINNTIDYPSNTSTGEQIDFAISAKDNWREASIEIVDNQINGLVRGIRLANFNEMLTVRVNSNTIELFETEESVGILLDDIDATQSNTNTILNNTITDACRGIVVYDNHIPEIRNNNITLKTNVLTGGGNYGILLVNGPSAPSGVDSEVISNVINGESTTTNTSIYGISSDMTHYSVDISCNEINKTGTALHFGGVTNTLMTNNTPIYANEMDYNHNCFVLTNSSELWEVGDLGFPSDNEWLSNNVNYHTYTDGADGNLTTLFTRGGGLPYQPTNNGSAPLYDPILINNSATGSQYSCGGGGSSPIGPLSMGSSLPDFESNKYATDTASWLAAYQYYRALPDDSLIQGREVQNFKDSMALSPIGKLLQWQAGGSQSSLSLSQRSSHVKSLTANNPMEAKLKTVMDYQLTAQQQHWDTLTMQAWTELEGIANACPFEAGPAVYSARAFLMGYSPKQYVNACELYTTPPKPSLRLKSLDEIDSQSEQNIAVFPNPVKEQLTITLSLEEEEKGAFQLIDVKGRIIYEERIIDGVNQIHINGLSNSIYLYHIRVNNEIVRTDKLVVK